MFCRAVVKCRQKLWQLAKPLTRELEEISLALVAAARRSGRRGILRPKRSSSQFSHHNFFFYAGDIGVTKSVFMGRRRGNSFFSRRGRRGKVWANSISSPPPPPSVWDKDGNEEALTENCIIVSTWGRLNAWTKLNCGGPITLRNKQKAKRSLLPTVS